MLARLVGALRPARSRRDPLGPRGERAAAKYLRRRGYRILRRNLVVHTGEADLVALAPDQRTLVIVEVKTRRPADHGASATPPEAAITHHKRRKLLTVAPAVARKLKMPEAPIRIDVIAIDWPARGKPTLRHYEAAVTF
ncbi:MAG: YraN family protein [Planctomycetota bacterium]|nr:YraN family protein [Planctomycetota bacterium]